MPDKFLITAKVRIVPENAQAAARTIKKALSGVNLNVGVGGNRQRQQTAQQLSSIATAGTTTAKSLKKTSRAITDTTSDAELFGKQLALATRRMAAFAIGAGTLFKVVQVFKTALGDAIDFQQGLIKVAQVTRQPISALKGLSSEIGRLSTTFGVSSSKLLDSSRLLSQTGLRADEVRVALEALAKTELAPTFGDMEKSTEGAIAILRQFGRGVGSLEADFSRLNAIAANFAVESDDLLKVFKRAGGVFSAAGGNLEELAALFTSVRATTREEAARIATGFRTIFARIQRPSTIKFLKNLGIELRTATGEFVGPLEAVGRLNAALGELSTTGAVFPQIAEQLGGLRRLSQVIPLIQQFPTAQRALLVAQQGAASLTENAAKAQGAFAIQIEKVRQEFKLLIRTFTESESFKAILALILKTTSALIKLGQAIEPLIPLITLLGAFTLGRGIRNLGRGVSTIVGPNALRRLGPGRSTFAQSSIFAEGGRVGGKGGVDNVPAMLTAGEFVINKKSVQKIGLGNLRKLNKFNKGGVAGFQRGGLSSRPIGAVFGRTLPQPEDTKNIKSSQAGLEKLFAVGALALTFTSNIEGMNDSLKKVIETTANAAIQFTALSLILPSKSFLQPGVSQGRLGRVLKSRELGLGAGVAGLAAGTFFRQRGLEDIQKGGASTTQTALGGAAAFAGIGAVIGSTILPGFGTAVGAAAGGVIGFTLALNEAEAKIKTVAFEKKFTEFSDILTAVADKRATAASQFLTIEQRVRDINLRLITAEGDAREKLQGSIKQSIPQINQFLEGLAKGSTTFEQFENRSRGLINLMARFTQVPVNELNKTFISTFKNQKKAEETTKKLIARQSELARRIRNIVDITAAIQDARSASAGFVQNVEQLEQFVRGSATLRGVADRSDILDRPNRVINRRQFADVINQIAANFGERGKGLAKEAISASAALSQLPDVILGLRGLDIGEDLTTTLQKRLRGFDERIINIITENAEKLGTEKFFSLLSKNPLELANELGGGVEDFIEVFKTAAPILKQQSDDLVKAFNVRIKIEQTLVSQRDKLIDILEIREKTLSSFKDEQPSLGRLQQLSGLRLANILGQNAGLATPAAIGGRLQQLQGRVETRRQIIGETPFKDRQRLLDVQAKEIIQINRLTSALEFLADTTRRTSNIQKELKVLQEQRKNREKLAQRFVFGTGSERREILRGLVGAIKLAQTRDIQSIPGSVAGGALAILEQFKDAPIFKGVTRDVLKNALGVDFGKPGKPEANLREQLLDAIKVSESARIELIKNIGLQNETLNVKIGETFSGFIQNLDSLFKTVEERRFKRELAATKVRETEAQRRRGAIGGLGVGPGQVGALRNVLPDIETLAKLRKRQEAIRRVRTLAVSEVREALPGDIKDVEVGRRTRGLRTFPVFGLTKQDKNTVITLIRKDIEAKLAGFDIGTKFLDKATIRAQSRDTSLEDIVRIFDVATSTRLAEERFKKDSKLNEAIEKSTKQINTEFSSSIDKLVSNVDVLRTSFAQFSDKDTVGSLDTELRGLTSTIKNIQTELGRGGRRLPLRGDGSGIPSGVRRLLTPPGRQFGGSISGPGGIDNVPAMLTAGEFVMRKEAVDSLGTGFLSQLNSVQGFQRGGPVRKSLSFKRRQQLLDHLSKEYNVLVTQNRATSENMKKIPLFDLLPEKDRWIIPLQARNIRRGLPKNLDISSGPVIQQQQPTLFDKITRKEFRKLPIRERKLARREFRRARRGELGKPQKPSAANIKTAKAANIELAKRTLARKQRAEKEEILRVTPNFAAIKRRRQDRIEAGLISPNLPPPRKTAGQIHRESTARAEEFERKRRRGRGFQTGGQVGGGTTQRGTSSLSLKINPESLSKFESSVQNFSQIGDKLSTALDNFPHEVTLQANHRVEVLFNGAATLSSELLTKLGPAFEDMAQQQVEKAINELKTSFNLLPN